jgi:hypothetical protein
VHGGTPGIPKTAADIVKKKRSKNAPPRAQRFDIQLRLSYRACGETAWHRGLIKNISCSGVLFSAEQPLKAKTPVEMIFEMPVEVGGEIGAEVAYRGEIVRSDSAPKDNAGILLAATIAEYNFMRGGMRHLG